MTRAVFICAALSLLLVSCSGRPTYPEPPHTAAEVEIDTKALKPEIPQFFTYHYRDKEISFFVISVRGRVLSFFDACGKCYPWKLGYRFDGGFIVCRKCNVRYAPAEIEKGIGSCFPVRVSGQLRGDKYIIPVQELEKGAHMF